MKRLYYPTMVILVAILAILLVTASSSGAQPVQGEPPDPRPFPPWETDIYYGAVPPHNPEGRVLVFVHGYRGVAQDWWTKMPLGAENDMYLRAYEAGYRTAFVNLGGPDGKETGSVWDNGLKLSQFLETILRHYKVDTLTIVGHSKGGIDAQAAVVHNGSWRIVDRVFTLASPHQGSELADLLYSDWAGWLAALLGLQDDATYTLQTGYMQYFRSLTDPKASGQDVIYYRAAGTDTGPIFSGLWLSGLYLSLYGENDGAVTVVSTELVGARTLFIEPYHHYNIFLGSTAFPWIEGALDDPGQRPKQRVSFLPFVASNMEIQPPPPRSRSEFILRGGLVFNTAQEVLPIETDTLKVSFDLLVASDTVSATLTAPDGTPRPVELIPPDGNRFLPNIWHLVYTGNNPLPGDWTFTITSSSPTAYLLIVVIESPLGVRLEGWPEGPVRPGTLLKLRVRTAYPGQGPITYSVTGRLTRSLPGRAQSPGVLLRRERGTALHCTATPCIVVLPDREGVYVLSATVTGVLPDGSRFERSFIRSVGVVTEETLQREPTLLDQ